MDDPALFPPLNAGLNGLAFVLLLTGRHMIKTGREQAHRRCMIGALEVSVLFLVSYFYYHMAFGLRVEYAGPEWARTPYLALLLSHTVLAAAVPILAVRTAWLGLSDRREAHRRWARWTFPIWIYVSLTGVAIYLVLYVLTNSGRIAFEGLAS